MNLLIRLRHDLASLSVIIESELGSAFLSDVLYVSPEHIRLERATDSVHAGVFVVMCTLGVGGAGRAHRCQVYTLYP